MSSKLDPDPLWKSLEYRLDPDVNLTIPLPLAASVLLPAAQSPFVGVVTFPKVAVWDMRTGQPAGLVDLGKEVVIGNIVLSPDGRYLCGATPLNKIEIRSVATGQLVREFAKEFGMRHLDFTGPEELLTTTDKGLQSLIRIYSVVDGKVVREFSLLKGHRLSLLSRFVLSPGRRYGALPSGRIGSATVYVYDLTTGKMVSQAQAEIGGTLVGTAFSPDGKELVVIGSVHRDKQVHLTSWRLEDGQVSARHVFDEVDVTPGLGDIEGLFDGAGWRIHDDSLVDRVTGQKFFDISGAVKGRLARFSRRPVGPGQILVGQETSTLRGVLTKLVLSQDGAEKVTARLAMDPVGNAPSAPGGVAPPSGPSEADVAAQSEQQSRELAASLYSSLLASDSDPGWDQLRFCEALQRPLLGIRFGLGTETEGPVPSKDVELFSSMSGQLMIRELSSRADRGEFGHLESASPAEARKPLVLGFASRNKLLATARRHSLDALLLASIETKVQGLNRRLETDVTMRLMDVATGEQVWISEPLKQLNATVGKQFSDYVIKNLAEKCKLGPMEDASRTADQRLALVSKKDYPLALAALVEVRCYQHNNWITTERAKVAYQANLGMEAGLAFAEGDPLRRRQVLDQWAAGKP